MAFALERQDRVDDVLENARPRESAFLGDVAHDHDADAASLGFLHESVRATADLHDGPGSRSEFGIDHRLDGVDDDERGFDLVDGGDDVGHRHLGEQPQVGADGAETIGAKTHLLRTLFGGHVEHGTGCTREQLQQERALADARLATQERDRTGDEPTTENTVEFGNAGGDRIGLVGIHLADRRCFARGDECETGCEGDQMVVGPFDVLDQGVPGTARETLARPLRMCGTAFGATVYELQLCHVARLLPG